MNNLFVFRPKGGSAHTLSAIAWTVLSGCALVLFLCVMATAAAPEDARYSFEFRNTTVSRALERISRETGVEIITNKAINERIDHQFYRNRTLERIIQALVRDVECAIVWGSRKRHLYSVGIFVFAKGASSVPQNFAERVYESRAGDIPPDEPEPVYEEAAQPDPESEPEAGAPDSAGEAEGGDETQPDQG
ncbi:MAG: hypothetical protein ACLFOY_09645 [Desulfatibacillaceae bacterium]